MPGQGVTAGRWNSPSPTSTRCCEHRFARSPRRSGTGTSTQRAVTGGRTDELWQAVAEPGFLSRAPARGVWRRWRRHERARGRERGARRAGVPAAARARVGRRSASSWCRGSAPTRSARAGCPGLCTGEKMVFAITEPDAGSNSHNLSTTATRDGDVYRLRGTKTYISGVDEAPAVLVVARTGVDEDTGHGAAVVVRRRHRRARARTHAHPGGDQRAREAVPAVLRRRRGARRPAARRSKATGSARSSSASIPSAS